MEDNFTISFQGIYNNINKQSIGIPNSMAIIASHPNQLLVKHRNGEGRQCHQVPPPNSATVDDTCNVKK
eukprot:2918100-Ditylum_brightwellii.AAC.1